MAASTASNAITAQADHWQHVPVPLQPAASCPAGPPNQLLHANLRNSLVTIQQELAQLHGRAQQLLQQFPSPESGVQPIMDNWKERVIHQHGAPAASHQVPKAVLQHLQQQHDTSAATAPAPAVMIAAPAATAPAPAVMIAAPAAADFAAARGMNEAAGHQNTTHQTTLQHPLLYHTHFYTAGISTRPAAPSSFSTPPICLRDATSNPGSSSSSNTGIRVPTQYPS